MDTPEHRHRFAPGHTPEDAARLRSEWDEQVIVRDGGAEARAIDNVWFFAAIVVIGMVLGILFWPLGGARAQGHHHHQAQGQLGDFGVGHAQWDHFYSSGEQKADGTAGPIMRPYDPSIRCCHNDCRPTLARYRNGQWFVLMDGQFDPVPADRIKRNVISPNGMAHVCAHQRSTKEPIIPYCFIPPEGAS